MSTTSDEPKVMVDLDDGEARLVAQLALAAEHLRHEQLDQVRAALDKLTASAPDDLRVQNLRGLYLFRTERYAEAREVYRVLVIDHATDAALRLNLGLVELKLGDHASAAENLRRVVEAEPGNQRAQGYLGLALMRAGELRGAQQAFHKAGQRDLEDRVAARLAELEEEGNLQRTELERAAGVGSSMLDGEQPFSAPENEAMQPDAPRGTGRWQLRVPGERLPLPSDEPAPTTPRLVIAGADPVAAFASARMLRGTASGETFSLADGGLLVTTVTGRVHTRTVGALSSSATLTFEPLRRRVRGQAVEEAFGDDPDSMFIASGRGTMVVSPRGGTFVLLRLEDDIVYLKEGYAFAFEDSLGWENGRLPGAGGVVEPPRIVQFRGQGRIVVRSAFPLFTLKIEPDAPHIVDAQALAGWIGRVQPRLLRGESDEPTPYVECSGEGVLLIEEPRV